VSQIVKAIGVCLLGVTIGCAAPRGAPETTPPSPVVPVPRIVIDGHLDDWAGVPLWTRFDSSPAGVTPAPLTVHAADDPHFWYLAISMRDTTVASAMPGTLHLLVDADADHATGSRVYEMPGVDFALDLSRLDKVQAERFGAGHALRTVRGDALGAFQSAYDLEVVVLPSWGADRFELRLARSGGLPDWPRLASPLRARLVYVAHDSVRVATPVQEYMFTTPSAATRPSRASTIPSKPGGAVRIAHWNVSEGSFREPQGHARLLAAVKPDVIMLDEMHGDVDSTSLAAFFRFPELAALGSWQFVYGRSGGRQRGVVAARDRSIRSADAMSYMRYPDGALDSLARADTRIPQRVIEIERTAQIAATGAWVDVDGIETLFVPVDLTSSGYLGSPNDAFRLLQARTIRGYVLDEIGTPGRRAPVFIAGDFNAVASYASVRALQDELDVDGSALALNRALRLDGRTATTWRNATVGQFTPGRLDLALFSGRVFTQVGGFVFTTEDLSDPLLELLQLSRELSQQTSDHLIVVTDLRRRVR
jgi:hypothetical protein